MARRPATIAAVVAVVVVFGIANTRYALHFSDRYPGALDLTPTDIRPLQGILTSIHAPFAYGDYWLAYPLTEATHEHLVASPVDDPRSAYHQAIVQASRTRVWVFFADSPRDRRLPSQLRARHVTYHRVRYHQFALYVFTKYYSPTNLAHFWSTVPAGYG